MPLLKKYTKQPWDVKDYDVDYAEWLAEVTPSDTLATISEPIVECISEDPDNTLVVDSADITATRIKIMVSGGTDGKRYKVTLRVTTAGVDSYVRKDECELEFIVKDT